MANALPGSAAAAPVDPALAPVSARLTQAQQADALAAEARDKVDTTDRSAPTVGRIVHYIAPDNSPRAAIITRVWEASEPPPKGAQPPADDPKFVNLRVLPEDHSDPQLRRQTSLVWSSDGFDAFGLQVPMKDPKNERQVHCWVWPPRV